MPRWSWPGLFSADIPETWDVHELGDLLEFVPPAPVGAAQISVLRRTKSSAVENGEAAELARDFAEKQGAEALEGLSEQRRGDSLVASARFSTLDVEGQLFWDVEIVMWRDRALRCTYCHAGTDKETRTSALGIFESIEKNPTN